MTEPLPILTRAQVRRLDALAASELAIPTILLMEHAAIALSRIALEMLPATTAPATVLLLAGPGNNGGDAFALARLLLAANHLPLIACAAPPSKYTGDALTNLTIAQRLNIPITHLPAGGAPALAALESFLSAHPPAPALIVDGLLGTGATTPPREPIASLIRWTNARSASTASRPRIPILAIDIPTGLDADTGAPLAHDNPALIIRATRTVTLGAAKPGPLAPAAAPFVGRLAVCDLALPRTLIDLARAE